MRGRRLRVVGILIVVASAIRVANVFTHFGFLTGDDVEIHEMTLGVALGKAWPVWDIRNAFYPMTFVFPVQRALVALGVTDVFSLVAAGRLFVTAIAALNVWILYRIGLSLSGDRGTALIAAALLAVSHLHMAYGSAELPRIVATAFLVPAFGAPARRRRRCGARSPASCSGSARRCASARSSSPLPPCCRSSLARAHDQTGAAWRVRVARAAALLAGLAATFLFAIGVSDALYWGRPFHSLLTIFDFTLVQRLSSSGFQPPWFYLTHISDWSDVLLVVLACLAPDRGSRRALLWAALPLVLLSLLLHKETRYAIPTIPFFALAAAPTLRSWIARGEVRAPRPMARSRRRAGHRAPRRGGRRLRRRQVPLRPLGSRGAPRLGRGAIASGRDRGRAAVALRRAPLPRRVGAAHRSRSAGARRRAACCATRCAGRTCIGQPCGFARSRPR